MLYNYNEVSKMTASLKLEDGRTIEGMLCELRIDPNSIPEGHSWYHIRHSDDDWIELASIKQGGIMVNFYGTLISPTDLELTEEIDIIDSDLECDIPMF